MHYYKTRVFIKVPRDHPISGGWSRVSRISLSYVTNPARDWYKCNNPTFKLITFLASSGGRDLISKTVTINLTMDRQIQLPLEMCSGAEAGSYLRLIDFLYHSTLAVRVIKKQKSNGKGKCVVICIAGKGSK